MKILIYEANAGFTSYTKPLVNAISNISDMSVSLMTSKNNRELEGISPCVNVLGELSDYKGNLKHGTFLWLVDRVLISWRNIVKRNCIVAKSDYDVILVEFTLPIIDRYYFGRMKKKSKVLLTVHDVIPPNRSRFWSMKSLKKLYNDADYLIVHSQENLQELKDNFQINEDKVTVIHHGVEHDKRVLNKHECRRQLKINEYENVILFYGGIRQQKGLDNLIQALDGVECTLIIAGALPHGESFEQYEQLIKRHNIKTLKIIEYVSDEMTDVVYGAADIVALPYKYFFSQSGVFMQAIQYRKLIVASNVSSFSSYVEKYKLGLVCRPNDIESLAAAIKETIGNKVALYQKARFDVALKDNSWEASAEKHSAIINKVKDC